MIVTKDFFKAYGCCEEGYRYALEVGAIDNWTLDECITHCLENGLNDFAADLSAQKTKEVYVRFNGNIITMGSYQVFHPKLGQHLKFETEIAAKNAALDIANELLLDAYPNIMQEISNENGDCCWIPADIKLKIKAVLDE